MGRVLQFPRERDRNFVWRQASWLLSLPMPVAEKQIARQLEVQKQTMIRRGIAADLIPRHLASIEASIRDAMFTLAAATGGAA